jgi:predicted nucleic acid-binding protein
MLLDSWAWMELFTQGKGAGRVMEVLDESPTIHTCPVVVAEVYTNVARRADEATARKVTARVLDDAILLPHGEEHATSASAIFLAQRRKSRSFPLSDGFVLAAAKAEGLRVLSGDPHFRGLPEVEFLG